LGAILEFQISQNTRGEVLIFISGKEVAKKGYFMSILPQFAHSSSIWATFWI
jgi:hypothetical protein